MDDTTHTRRVRVTTAENRVRSVVWLTVLYPCQLPGFDVTLRFMQDGTTGEADEGFMGLYIRLQFPGSL